ncbi:MAG: ATP-grasp domain-containing protein [Bdellovibrionales bacterium]|nr:ATP-grasp domain-containing protein [Bdellovibrionales bacterium]
MKTILLTAIGGDIGQAIASVIRSARPDIQLIGVDMNLRHGGSFFVDKFFQIPPANDPGYFESIKKIASEYSVDALLPVSEVELDKFLEEKNWPNDIPIISCGKTALEVGLSKYRTYEFLKSINIDVPWTIPVGDEKPKEFPCIMKSTDGSGSKSVYVVNNQVEADFYKLKSSNFIYQELLLPADQEVTCAVYRSKDGRVAVLQMLRQLVGGLTGWAEVINDLRVDSMCRKLAKDLNLLGSLNVQLRITKEGPRIFEINPRFSSTVHMRHLLGFTDVIWTISEFEGVRVEFPEVPIGQRVIKRQIPEIIK